MAGDFNLHHPLWNPQGYTKHEAQADELIEMMADHKMRLLLPPGTITFPNAGTTIDLTWGNENAEQSLLKCQISEDNDHGSDHLPIETILDIQQRAPEQIIQLAYNYAKTDWKTLETKLHTYLPDIIDTDHTTPEILDQFALDITNAFQKAIDETTPRKKPCPFSKRWWNDDLTRLRKATNRRRNRYRRSRNEWDREEWKHHQNKYKHEIRRAKEKIWRDFVMEANERTIWTVKKYMDSIPTPTYIPTLNNETATSNTEKVIAFQETFFPPPPSADVSDIRSTVYPQPVNCVKTITMRQIQMAVSKLMPNKAPAAAKGGQPKGATAAAGKAAPKADKK
jgi:primosomal protein N'